MSPRAMAFEKACPSSAESHARKSSSCTRASSTWPIAVQMRFTACSLKVSASNTRRTLASCCLLRRPSPPILTLRKICSTRLTIISSAPPSSSASDRVTLLCNSVSAGNSSPLGIIGASISRPMILLKMFPLMPDLKYLSDLISSQPRMPKRRSERLFSMPVSTRFPAWSEYLPGKRRGSSRIDTRMSCSFLFPSPNGSRPVTSS
mmetsp:Transcript_80475/g.202460  ORF Transcript_80475/g.202460 Transcript_80475/m.202460 type:complete len:205 (+) Transcript_80475:421-1035(+)